MMSTTETTREILRFQEGVRNRHPAPGAAVHSPPPGTPADAGNLLAVLVDLAPHLPHRSRELRTLTAQAYWASSGSVVARLRRALAEANRHLVRANKASAPERQGMGTVTCAVLFEEELFVGQVGEGRAFLVHPDGTTEEFPQPRRPLPLLGTSLPPVVHVGYAPLEPGSTLVLATEEVAAVLEDEARPSVVQGKEGGARLAKLLAAEGSTGSAVWLRRGTAEGVTPRRPKKEKGTARAVPQRTSRAEKPPPAEPPPPPPPAQDEEKPAPAIQESATHEPVVSEPAPQAPHRPPSAERGEGEGESAASRGVRERGRALLERARSALARRREGRQAKPRRVEVERKGRAEEDAPRRSLPLPKVSLPSVDLSGLTGPEAAWRRVRPPRIPVKPVAQALLPGRVPATERRPRRVPRERPIVVSGVVLGVLLVVVFITVWMFMEFGGPERARSKLEDARQAREEAFSTQTVTDWNEVLRLSEQVMALDSDNEEARALYEEAKNAIDAQENAAILSASQIVELGTSPTPRRLLVSQPWIYLLDPAADTVTGFQLHQDGIQLSPPAPIRILEKGQTLMGEAVGDLVDMAWMEPGAGYPDGAVFIYSDNGSLYIYEPTLGPRSISRERLPGELPPGAVSQVGTYVDQFYIIDRRGNQLLKYVPINGLYESPPRPYFAEGSAPPLQTALDMALDGRLYLLLGEDGDVHTYASGTEDYSFEVRGLPDPDFHPTAMAMEDDPEEGRIYLGDPQQERIVVLDKRGHYLHQYRLSGKALRHLEILDVSEEPHVLYFVADNHLYAAPIPEFAGP
jgi:hypothetical protein